LKKKITKYKKEIATHRAEIIKQEEALFLEFPERPVYTVKPKSVDEFKKLREEEREFKKKEEEFEKKVEDTQKESISMHSALKEQLLGLKDLNVQMTKEATNLTKALKGDSKMQGNWGELVLERLGKSVFVLRQTEQVPSAANAWSRISTSIVLRS